MGKAPSAEGAQPELERIRDIIFGTQMREYTQRFDEVRADLERLRTDVERLGQQLAEEGATTTAKLEDLRRELRRGDDAVREELRAARQDLGDRKVDREVLAQLFIQIATQLQGGGSLEDIVRHLGAERAAAAR